MTPDETKVLLERATPEAMRENAEIFDKTDDASGPIAEAFNLAADTIEALTRELDAMADALTAILNTSGARVEYHSLKYAKAVEGAEQLLAALTPKASADEQEKK